MSLSDLFKNAALLKSRKPSLPEDEAAEKYIELVQQATTEMALQQGVSLQWGEIQQTIPLLAVGPLGPCIPPFQLETPFAMKKADASCEGTFFVQTNGSSGMASVLCSKVGREGRALIPNILHYDFISQGFSCFIEKEDKLAAQLSTVCGFFEMTAIKTGLLIPYFDEPNSPGLRTIAQRHAHLYLTTLSK